MNENKMKSNNIWMEKTIRLLIELNLDFMLFY